ncbi:Phage capsid family protein [Gimesia panareensis]|uniref:Phage capsid family protein n=1 Tax=Gimesia panareensis TaxID=2527978 RepID=A0A517QFT1_9PLAN|nr:phage major capsid protein [Gimesia panareensis]QDT30474.1 Phage capsid family protein [Gimesia panareensis]
MSETLEEKVKSLSSNIESLTKSVDQLNSPDISGVRHDSQGRLTSYWESDESPSRSEKFNQPQIKSLRTFPNGYQPYSEFQTFGEFIRCGFKDRSELISKTKKSWGMCKAIQGMSEVVGADGGIAILPEFHQDILTHIYQNDIFGRTDHYQVAGNNMTFPTDPESSRADGSRAGGLRAYWVGEGDPLTGTTPKLGETTLKLNKLAVLVYLTEELINDNGLALESYVNKKVTEEMEFMLGESIFNGNGVGKPLGIMQSSARVTVPKESGQAANTIVAENILHMWSRMRATSRKNSAWFINQDTEPQLHQMSLGVSTAGGQLVYMPPSGLSGASYATLMGRPVIPTEFNETLGTEGDIMLSSLDDYITISKGGIEQAESMHVEFLTDQLALRFIMRIDGKPWETQPLTPYKGTATQSSFVTLATRS